MVGYKRTVILCVTVARIFAAILILYMPLTGIIATMILDFLDGRIFAATRAMNREDYHKWDKLLDMLGYVTELTVVYRYGVFLPFLYLFIWRSVGYMFFAASGKSGAFLVCPNIFEAAVLWLFLFYPTPQAYLTRTLSLPWNWLWILIALKFVQEWSLHWFVPHGGNAWWDNVMRKWLPAGSPWLPYVLSLSTGKSKKRR